MPHRNTKIDSFNGGETPEQRTIRAQLRLSGMWKVLGRTVRSRLPEYSDDDPDIPDVISADGVRIRSGRLGTSVIGIEAERGRKYKCPNCGSMCSAHEFEKREYTHVADLGYDCTLSVRLPKLDCGGCGRKMQIRFPAARPGVSYTKEFEKAVLIELMDNSISAAAEKLGVGRWIAADILDHCVSRAVPEQDLSDMTVLYVDEIQFGSGHDYVTVFSDGSKKIVFMTRGKGKDTIERFSEYLIIQGGHPDNVRVVSADMSSAFEAGVEEFLPNASLVFDRFHLVQAINNDLNAVRKRTLKRGKERLSRIKYTVLHREENMDDDHKLRLEKIRLNNPELALAFDMKEAFCNILDNTDMYEAQAEFEEWYAWVMTEGCIEMKERARKFMAKVKRIMAWFDHRVNNGTAEGINSMIKKTKSQACGYSNLRNFISMCLFRHGKLTVRV